MAVKASGSIALVRIDDGEKGERGPGIYKVTTAPSSFTTTTGGFTPTYRIALSTVKTQSKVTEVLVGDVLQYSYYQYPVGYVDSSYVYCGARTSIRGATGATGATGSAGADGADGADGIGISAIVTQYYLSTSSSSQSGGSWSTTQATWVTGRYYWTREMITWTDGSTTYTTAVLATGLNTAMQDAYDAEQAILAWCYNNNKTYIDGAKIYTGSLTALGNVTAGSFNLGNGKFVVDSDGYLTATGASIYGNMFIDSTSTVTFSYTSTDLTTIQNIIMGTTSSTDAYVQKYDVNGDGYISSSDYNLVQKIINAGNSITTSFILNPTFDTTNYSDGVLNVSVDGFHTTRISSLGALYSTYATIDTLSVGTLNADTIVRAKCMYKLMATSVSVSANGVVPFETENVNDGSFTISSGRITVQKNMIASISALICGAATGGRLWCKLRINGTAVTNSIIYGTYNTADIPSYVVELSAGDIVDVIMVEAITLQSAGVTGSYISIIEL